MITAREFIDAVSIDQEVYGLRPDYSVLVIAIDGVRSGSSDDESRMWLQEAASVAADVDHAAHVDAWRSAYRSFGVRPQKFRSSFDALGRRAAAGLPEVNKVVDAYNAISVAYGLPIGGENLDAYQGSLRLVRATGEETFDTSVDGHSVCELVDTGEVVWRDDVGVTCRRWNWRQCLRTRMHENTNRAFFLLEFLDPFSVDRLSDAGEALIERVAGPTATVVSRLLRS